MNISSPSVDNVYGHDNMLVQNFVLILKTKNGHNIRLFENQYYV